MGYNTNIDNTKILYYSHWLQSNNNKHNNVFTYPRYSMLLSKYYIQYNILHHITGSIPI